MALVLDTVRLYQEPITWSLHIHAVPLSKPIPVKNYFYNRLSCEIKTIIARQWFLFLIQYENDSFNTDRLSRDRGKLANTPSSVYVVVKFSSHLIFIFPLFLGMVMYANEFKTKEK